MSPSRRSPYVVATVDSRQSRSDVGYHEADQPAPGVELHDERCPGSGRIVHRCAQGLERIYHSPASWALLDQIIVSGMRFVTTILVGRFCGPEDLGIYVLAFSAILAVSLSQESLIARPFQVFWQSMKAARQRIYAGSSLIQLLALATFVMVVALLAALALLIYAVNPKVCWVVFTLALTMPGILLWEFVRRQAFAMMEMRSAAMLDGCLAILQLTSLLALGFFGQLTVARALFLIAMSSTCVGVVRLLQQRSRFQYSRRLAGLDIRKNWRFGRWFFVGQVVGLVQAYAVPWILTFYYGAEKTGILMACQTLVLLSNPLLLGLANWLGPASVRTYLSDGLAGLNRLLIKVSLLSQGCMVAFAFMLYLLGEWILVLTFGSGFAGYGHLVAITGITALGFSMTNSGSSGLAAIQHPRLIMYGTLVGSVVSIATLPGLVQYWGLTGAAWALAAGSMTTGLVQLLGYVFISKAISGTASHADARGN